MEQFEELYKLYNTKLKPLVNAFEVQEQKFEEPLLKNITWMLDEVSLGMVGDETGDNVVQQQHIKNAFDYLNDCISYGYLYLLVPLQRKVRHFERRFSKGMREDIDNGRFAGPYEQLKKEAKQTFLAGKEKIKIPNTHASVASADFSKAYEDYKKLGKNIQRVYVASVGLKPKFRKHLLLLVEFIVSIILSVLIALFFKTH